ncbi:MAG: V-type ATPase 116kDa subunit family protein [Candidatus Altiarchaeota archaeon]
MFKPVRMTKVKVICLAEDAEETVRLLHRIGLLELARNTDTRLASGRSPEALAEVSSLIMKFDGLLEFMRWGGGEDVLSFDSRKELLAKCSLQEDLAQRAGGLLRQLDELRKRRRDLAGWVDFSRKLGRLSFDPSLLSVKSLAFFFGKMPTHSLREFTQSLYHVTNAFEIRCAKANRLESYCLLAVDRRYLPDVEAGLKAGEFSKLTEADVGLGIEGGIGSILSELRKAKAEESALEEKRNAMSAENGARIAGLRRMLVFERQRLEVQSRFGYSSKTVSIEGWIRADRHQSLLGTLDASLGGRVVVEELTTDEEPPAISSVPEPLKPFSDMVEFMSVPHPREIDPTLAFAIIYPLFYGMMLGDVGYGLLSLPIGIALAKKTSGLLRSLGLTWAYASFAAMGFGVVYDEYFGLSHESLIGFSLYHPPLERLGNIGLLLAASIVMGIIHIAFGLMLGFADKWAQGERRHAFGKLGWIGMELSLAVFASIYILRILDPSYSPLLAAGLIGLALIFRSEGFQGLVELPSLASNIMSYTRIVAIGVSSLAIAGVLNTLLWPTAADGIAVIAFKLPLLAAGHLLNLGLGMFESMVQSARLNYVEFFSKFFTGGGRRFKPFNMDITKGGA